MGLLAATALAAYVALWPIAGFWPLLSLNLVALTAQSALMPLGDSITLTRSAPRGSITAASGYGARSALSFPRLEPASSCTGASGERVLPLVIGTSALLMFACRTLPSDDASDEPTSVHRVRRAGIRRIAGDPRFWIFVATASALQASHQVYYGFGSLYWRSLGFSQATIGWLWAEGVVAETLLFWQGRRLLLRFGPVGLMALGGLAGVIRWGLAGLIVLAARGRRAAIAARPDLWGELSRRDALSISHRAACGGGQRANDIRRRVIGLWRRPRHDRGGRALCSLRRVRVSVYGGCLGHRSRRDLAAAIRPAAIDAPQRADHFICRISDEFLRGSPLGRRHSRAIPWRRGCWPFSQDRPPSDKPRPSAGRPASTQSRWRARYSRS